VSGKHISGQQVSLYMTYRKTQTQSIAAAKAHVFERLARRINNQQFQHKLKGRSWRTPLCQASCRL